MGIDATSGSLARPATPASVSAALGTTAKAAAKATTAGQPAVEDKLSLSPEAQALATLKTLNSPATNGQVAAKDVAATMAETISPASKKVEDDEFAAFTEKVKSFFAKSMGIDEIKLGRSEINDKAMRYILSHTIIGALAPASVRKRMGVDTIPPPAEDDTVLSSVAFFSSDPAKRSGPPVVRVLFDGKALQKFSHLPMEKKDKDGDKLFTAKDLMPNVKNLKAGTRIDNDYRFDKADREFAEKDENVPKDMSGTHMNRVTLVDDFNHPYFLARFDKDMENPGPAAARACFSLIQGVG
jgi:hypothetical protein